jgi:hypothetical protein
MKSSDPQITQKRCATALPSDVRKVFDLPTEFGIVLGLRPGSGHSPGFLRKGGRKGIAFPHIRRQSRLRLWTS